MSTDVTVRVMRPEELDAMIAVSVAAFDDPRIDDLLRMLRASWAWDDDLSFVAERNGEIVGQVLYTHAFVDAPERTVDVLVLSPVGVLQDLQQSGVGGQLISVTLELLRTRPEPLVFLEGTRVTTRGSGSCRRNPGHYPRFRFVPAEDLGFRKPSLRIPAAAFMVHPLPGYEPWMTGTLVYPDAFWRTDSVGLRG